MLISKQNQPMTSSTGTSSMASQPSGTMKRTFSGILLQAKAKARKAIGVRINRLTTPGRLASRNGASHRPARKPRITVGSASISSMIGLTLRRMAGAMK